MNVSSTLAALVISVWLFSHPDFREYNKMAYPIGIRLNNPGDIKKTKIDWLGMTKLQDHEKFVRYLTPYHGIRAIMKVLMAYKNVHGLDRLDTILSRYAPASDGNLTREYIREISERTGFFPSEVLDIKNVHTLISLAKAIVIQEQGIAPIEFPEAWYEDFTYYEAAENVIKEDKEKEHDKQQPEQDSETT